MTLSQLGAEQAHLVRLVGELDGRLSETLTQMSQMASFLPEEGLQRLLETNLSTRVEFTSRSKCGDGLSRDRTIGHGGGVKTLFDQGQRCGKLSTPLRTTSVSSNEVEQ